LSTSGIDGKRRRYIPSENGDERFIVEIFPSVCLLERLSHQQAVAHTINLTDCGQRVCGNFGYDWSWHQAARFLVQVL
jgi:hypothetical protein